ncbi:MAG: regulatory protein RecX [Candidatus Omnitrophica bacterium]|nr:regulatory protein RecX [Candidatus Omnitrophota bacterium]
MVTDKDFNKAKAASLRLLAYRQRSVKEIKDRLKKKGFSDLVINKTVEYLTALNYLDDREFARFWIQDRIRTRPQGMSLLRYQLRQKGISREIIKESLSEYAGDYDEYEAAKKLVALRSRRYRGLDPQKSKRRLYDYLCRRGFSQDVISQAIE